MSHYASNEYPQHMFSWLKDVPYLELWNLKNSWWSFCRRHYLAHQVGKDFNKKCLLNQAKRCLQGWRFVIQRKHLAEQFHDKQLVRNSFNFWNTITLRRLQQKQMEKIEYVSLFLWALYVERILNPVSVM